MMKYEEFEEIYQEGYRAGCMSVHDDMEPPYSGLAAEYWSDGFEDACEDINQIRAAEQYWQETND